MSIELFLAMALFAFVASITPGPNNLMLMATGANAGYKKCLPQMVGVVIGFNLLLLGLALGLVALMTQIPQTKWALRLLGSSYLLYLSYRLAMSRSLSVSGDQKVMPLSFLASLAFQWVNPKGWSLGATAIVQFIQPEAPIITFLGLAIIYSTTNFFAVSSWTLFGSAMQQFLAQPQRLKYFNISMGLLLALTIIPVWLD